MFAVGLLPAALQGIDIRATLQGKEMDAATRNTPAVGTPVALLALGCAKAVNGRKDMVVLPYKASLLLFSRYFATVGDGTRWQGKRPGRSDWFHQGIAVYGNKGLTDLNSLCPAVARRCTKFLHDLY